MFVVIALNILAVFFAYLNSYKEFRHGLKISFTLIFIFLALRYNFGNDYMAYYSHFLTINNYTSINYFNKSFQFEPGWQLLCRVFKPLGFFAMVIFLALINCIVYYRFINRYVPVKYYWLAVFIYVFDPTFMLINISAMRQSLAIALFLTSIPYIYKKDLIRFLLCIGVAYIFHSSALILLPLYLLGIFNWEINKAISFILVALFASLFLFQKTLVPYLNSFINSYFEKYEIYQGAASTIGTGLGVLYFSALFILVLYYARFQHMETALVFKITIISFMFIPLGLLIPLIGRVGMYLVPATIITYPVILMNMKKPAYKIIFVALLVFMTTYIFYQFFISDTYRAGFGTYHTIFSSQ